MNDNQLKAHWASITDLDEALEQFMEHQEFAASSDPYYGDLTAAVWEMLTRCYEAKKAQKMGADMGAAPK